MARHSSTSKYRIRRFHDGSRAAYTLSGAEVSELCISLPCAIQAMRKNDLTNTAEYSSAVVKLLDMTLSIWWGFMPEHDALSCQCEREDFVQAVSLVILEFVDRFDPSRSSWRTQAGFVRLEVRKRFNRRNRKTVIAQDEMERNIYAHWDGVYSAHHDNTEAKPLATIVRRRTVSGFALGRGIIAHRAPATDQLPGTNTEKVVDPWEQMEMELMG